MKKHKLEPSSIQTLHSDLFDKISSYAILSCNMKHILNVLSVNKKTRTFWDENYLKLLTDCKKLNESLLSKTHKALHSFQIQHILQYVYARQIRISIDTFIEKNCTVLFFNVANEIALKDDINHFLYDLFDMKDDVNIINKLKQADWFFGRVTNEDDNDIIHPIYQRALRCVDSYYSRFNYFSLCVKNENGSLKSLDSRIYGSNSLALKRLEIKATQKRVKL
jgi:hypothetical protein